jgi:hypothetical protein
MIRDAVCGGYCISVALSTREISARLNCAGKPVFEY